MPVLLEVRDLAVSYGKVEAVHRVSLDVDEGRIVTVIGPNGAGKTTLLGAIIGLLPSRGTLNYRNAPLGNLTVEQRVAGGLVLVPEKRELFASMTVADNLALGRLRRQTGAGVHWDDERIVWVFPRLAQRWYTPADYLSGGEQQMVAIARAHAGDVRLLLLDEPFEGLSPAITEELFEAFNRLRYEVAMVIVDHHLDLALALSDRTVILERGAVTWTGPSSLLRDDLELRRQKLWM